MIWIARKAVLGSLAELMNQNWDILAIHVEANCEPPVANLYVRERL
jgi:hypothetical protein